jgi:hypothetical protein
MHTIPTALEVNYNVEALLVQLSVLVVIVVPAVLKKYHIPKQKKIYPYDIFENLASKTTMKTPGPNIEFLPCRVKWYVWVVSYRCGYLEV